MGKFVLLTLLLGMLYLGCEKNALDELTIQERIDSETSNQVDPYLSTALTDAEGDRTLHNRHRPLRCFRPVFPLTVVFPDGSEVEVESKEEMKEIIKQWREDNPDATERPQISFPHEVELRNGEVVTVESKEDIRELLKECRDRKRPHDRRCFKFVFPVTIAFPDGTTAEADSSAALKELLHQWRQDNPNSEEYPSFVFPIDVELEDGTIVTVNNEEEFRQLRLDCRPQLTDCFSFVFPVSFTTPDGEVTVENEEELRELIARYRENKNDRRSPLPPLVYPQDVIVTATDQTITLENSEDLRRLLLSCRRK